MPGPIGLFIWGLATALEVCFVACSLVRGSFVRYFFLNLYVVLSLLASLARLIAFGYGIASPQYAYTYYYSDALLTVTLYIALISLYSYIFGELGFAKHIRFGAVVLLLGTAGFSYAVVAQSADMLSTDLAYTLSQNLYFVGLVLTYILWGAVLKLRETRTRVVQLVLSLGLYFSVYAASYALLNLAGKYEMVQYLSPALGCFLPLSWSITIMRYSEEARLAPANLVAVPR